MLTAPAPTVTAARAALAIKVAAARGRAYRNSPPEGLTTVGLARPYARYLAARTRAAAYAPGPPAAALGK